MVSVILDRAQPPPSFFPLWLQRQGFCVESKGFLEAIGVAGFGCLLGERGKARRGRLCLRGDSTRNKIQKASERKDCKKSRAPAGARGERNLGQGWDVGREHAHSNSVNGKLPTSQLP